MTRARLVVALLLTTGLANSAAAGERPDKASQKAQKINAYLDSIGINHPIIKSFAATAQNNMEDGALRLNEQKFEHGRMVLLYDAKPRVSINQLQLKYQPANYERAEIVADKKGVMFTYRWTLD